jgi:hypothetical protein
MLTPDVKDSAALEVYRAWGQFVAALVRCDRLTGIPKAICEEALDRDPVLRSATISFLVDDEAPDL